MDGGETIRDRVGGKCGGGGSIAHLSICKRSRCNGKTGTGSGGIESLDTRPWTYNAKRI